MSSVLTTYDKLYPAGFWQRQFLATRTWYQNLFDWIFGIVMPIVCFYLDPGIVRADWFIFGHTIFIYGLSALAIVTLSLWLSFGPRVKTSGAIIAGGLASGALCSFTIGVIILPLTIVGIFFIIGILGLVPFLTGFVYLRNATRAARAANVSISRPNLAGAIVLGGLIVAGLPAIGEFTVTRIVAESVNQILTKDPRSVDEAVQRVRYFRWLAGADKTAMDKIVRAYERELDQERKDGLARAYRELTGQEIQERLRQLTD